ncbi:MAG: hypothetical protein H3C43_04730 [Leptonema sp. (in: Bacteria)]|nr:hypothetical protein [Leptonema sp. (in: bacteria)]
MMKRYLFFSLTLLFGITFLGYCSSGGGNDAQSRGNFQADCLGGQITVYGEAPLFTSVSATRAKAKEDACRNAVEKCIGNTVASSSGVGDGQSLGTEIFSQAQGICKNDQIIDEKEYMLDTIKMMKLFVRFNVSQVDVRNSIDTMKKLVGNPKVMILIREEYNLAGSAKRVEGFTSRSGQAASQIQNVLLSKGYTIVDSRQVVSAGFNEELAASDPTKVPDILQDKAMAAGADVLVIGTIEANPQKSPAPQFKSYQATGTLSILALWGRGSVLGSYREAMGGAHTTDQAAAQAAIIRFAVGTDKDPVKKPGGFAKYLHSTLSAKWSELTRNNVIVMRVRGLDQVGGGTFRDDLMERTAVKNVDEISADSNEMIWEVTYPGREFALRDTLAFYGDDPSKFLVVQKTGKKLIVDSVKRGEIVLHFQ